MQKQFFAIISNFIGAVNITLKHEIKKVATHCILCNADQTVLVTTGSEHEYDNTTSDTFNVVQCRNCSLIYLNPRPDVSEISVIYPSNYYSYNQKKLRDQTNPNSILQRLRYKGFQAKITKSLSLCNRASGREVSVLDVGCGDGHTLDLYAARPDVQTHGVDFNLNALELAKQNGHSVYPGTFEDADLPSCRFNLVTATHVIEHVPDARKFLKKSHSVLRDNGILWLETPNIGSLDAKWFRRQYWGGYHFPRHWIFFTRQTLTELAQSEGFEPVFIDFVPNAIFWFWTVHSFLLSKFPQRRGLIDNLLPPVDFQKDSLANFLRICFFCSLDIVIKKVSGETSNMIIAFKKVGE